MWDWGLVRSDNVQDTVSDLDGAYFRLEDHLDRGGNTSKDIGFNIFAVRDVSIATPPEGVCLDGLTACGYQTCG